MHPTISEYFEAKREKNGDFHDRWFPRLQEIANALHYHGEDALLEVAIVETLLCLPEAVVAFVLAQCHFLSVGRACYAATMPADRARGPRRRKPAGPWLILLEERLPAAEAHGIIAHAVAHAWRQDDRRSAKTPSDCEAQTIQLVTSWGFSGRGASGDYCPISRYRGAMLLAGHQDSHAEPAA